jgi:DNA-binding NarL/FixJ family response regulator
MAELREYDLLVNRLRAELVKAEQEFRLANLVVRGIMPSPDKDERLAFQVFQAAVGPNAQSADGQRLTPREREVLALIASGQSSKQIAFTLGIGFKTVVCHRYRVQTKLKARNTADLTRAAIRMGLIEP